MLVLIFGTEYCTLLEGFGALCLYLLIVYYFIALVWILSWQTKLRVVLISEGYGLNFNPVKHLEMHGT